MSEETQEKITRDSIAEDIDGAIKRVFELEELTANYGDEIKVSGETTTDDISFLFQQAQEWIQINVVDVSSHRYPISQSVTEPEMRRFDDTYASDKYYLQLKADEQKLELLRTLSTSIADRLNALAAEEGLILKGEIPLKYFGEYRIHYVDASFKPEEIEAFIIRKYSKFRVDCLLAQRGNESKRVEAGQSPV